MTGGDVRYYLPVLLATADQFFAQPQRGSKALEGIEERLPSHLFPATDGDRWLKGRGALIMIFDPEAPPETEPYWKWTDVQKDCDWQIVPKTYRIKILDAWVKISSSDPELAAH